MWVIVRHIARHGKFREKLFIFEEDFKKGELNEMDLFNFVKGWLSSHIKKVDTGYEFFI